MRGDANKQYYYRYLLSLLLKHQNRRAIQQIHSQLIITGVHSHHTRKAPFPIWNPLIRHYSICEFPKEALLLYKHIQHQREHIAFDSFAYSFLIKACANLQQEDAGTQLHGLTIKSGFEFHVYVQTALVNMYADCGSLVQSKKVFDKMHHRNSVTWNAMITGLTKQGELSLAWSLFNKMPTRNVVSWTGLIDGYTRMNQPKEALSLFRTMVVNEGIKPTELTILAILPSIWNCGSLELCQSIHSYGEKSGFNVSDIRVTNSLIDTYSKCGSVESALRIFEGVSMERRNVVSWNSIICGFAMHGMAKEAVENFRKMEIACVKPNRVSFLSILNACSHGGLVEEGLEFFKKMVNDCALLPEIMHYGCLVDMLGRAGRFEEAEKMALEIPIEMSNVVIWRTLLGSCSFHGNVEMGERVTRKIMQMERGYGGDYVLLSNIFAGVGRYDDSESTRKVMDENNALKVPGLSSI